MTLRVAVDLGPSPRFTAGSAHLRDAGPLARGRTRCAGLEGYDAALAALRRCHDKEASAAHWRSQKDAGGRGLQFLESYGWFLASVARVSAIMGGLKEKVLTDEAQELRGLADELRWRHRRLVEQAEQDDLSLEDPAQPFGGLLIEAAQLVDELQRTSDALHRYAER